MIKILYSYLLVNILLATSVYSQCSGDCILEYNIQYNKEIDSLEFFVKLQSTSSDLTKDSLNVKHLNMSFINVNGFYCEAPKGSFDRLWDTVKFKVEIPNSLTMKYNYFMCGYPPDYQHIHSDSMMLKIDIFEDSTIQFTPVSVSDINEFIELSVYPNPVTNFIEYNLSANTKTQNIKLEIFNLEGQLIKSFEQKSSKDKLAIENLKSGI